MNAVAPNVFLSHATEDKDRFVLALAERLRANGVNAWLDRWEMLPGDSLVDKIFEEGIGTADVFVVVLSAHSIAKPWVKEELNAGLVRRIEGKCRVIPIVLDDVEVPVALKSTVWQRIEDLAAYDNEFDALLRSILGVTSAPPVGPRPGYALKPNLPGLTQLDSVVLSALCQAAVTQNDRLVQGQAIRSACSDNNISIDALVEALHALDHLGLVDEVQIRNSGAMYVRLSWAGLLAFLDAARPELGSVQRTIVALLVNDPQPTVSVADLAQQVNEPRIVVEALLTPYELSGLLRIDRFLGGRTDVRGVSPLLRRELE